VPCVHSSLDGPDRLSSHSAQSPAVRQLARQTDTLTHSLTHRTSSAADRRNDEYDVTPLNEIATTSVTP